MAKDKQSRTVYQRQWRANKRKDPQWVAKQKIKQAAKSRRKQLQKYGLTLDEYNVIFEQQGGVCAICGQPELATAGCGVPKSLAVDHNHETGEVRGLLCSACNIGLGCMKDNPNILAKAIAYLTETQEPTE